MKKLLWIVGGLFVALFVAVLSIPLFVDVDQYRPQITAEANKKINGKLELGKLHLSLWGAIKIHAESIRVSVNGFPDAFVDTKEFHLEIPFSSIFAGQPRVTAVLRGPKISVVKELNGKMNALELLKTAPNPAVQPTGATPVMADGSAVDPVQPPPAAPATPAAPSAQPAGAAAKVPALLAGATLGLRIEKGDLAYVDKLAKSKYEVNGLELDAQNLGLGSSMEIKLTAPVKGSAPDLKFEGPIELTAQVTPVLVGTSVKSVKGNVEVIATRLSVEAPSFKKPAGMALTFRAQVDGTEKETLLRQADLQFHEIKAHAKGRVTLEPVTAKIDLNVDPSRLEQFDDFVPMLKEYDLKGSLVANTNVDLTPETLKVNGDLKVSDGSFFVKNVLKTALQFQAQAGFSENSLNLTRAALSGPDSEVQLVGSVKNFLAPQFAFALTGKSFDLDKTLVLPQGEAKQASVWPRLVPLAYAEEKKPDANPLAALAANPIMAKASGVFNAQVGKVTAYGSEFDQVQLKSQLQSGMQLKVSDASLRTFGGLVKANADFDLKSPALRFNSKGGVTNLSAQQAFRAYFPKYANTLEGVVNADWNVSGNAYPAATRIRSLKGGAKLLARDGVLKSVDFQESINSSMKKIPILKDKKPVAIDDGFKTLTASLVFNNGVIQIEPIDMQPRNKGFVVKGKSTIQESLEQESFFDIYDPQGILPKDIQQAGKPAIALRLYGPLTAPKTDYEYTVKKLATNAGASALKNMAGKALDKFLGGEQGETGGSGDAKRDALRDAADKLRKKFKF